MNNKLFINFVPGNTFFHKLTGGTKVMLFILYTVAIIATFDIRVIVPLTILPVFAIISMKPNYKPIKFMLWFLFIMQGLVGGLFILLLSPDAGLQQVGGKTIIWMSQSGKLYIVKETLWYIFITFLKRVASLLSVIVFMLSTTPSEFASGLAWMHVPYKVCTIVSLAYRTIPDIAKKFIDIKNSMQMRGVELSNKAGLGKRIKGTTSLLIPLIISSFGKVEMIANAMDLRGYGRLKNKSWYAEHEVTKGDKIVRFFCVLLLCWCIYYIGYCRIINPWPVRIWSPFIERENLQILGIFDNLTVLDWIKK